VADLSVALVARLDGSPTRQARLHRAARVHDAGKALLPSELVGRPAPLTTLESAHVRQHPALGAALAGAAHQERWDGAGYPDGRACTDIPGSGRPPEPRPGRTARRVGARDR
jgi:HD-GYP domain-containing protein (c-di-GMP phosphodiesterase class II)